MMYEGNFSKQHMDILKDAIPDASPKLEHIGLLRNESDKHFKLAKSAVMKLVLLESPIEQGVINQSHWDGHWDDWDDLLQGYTNPLPSHIWAPRVAEVASVAVVGCT